MALQSTDVIIIGAGPVGLFAIFECGMMRLRCCVIDALDIPGGQCAALYPEKPIYDIPAHPKILGGELIDQLKCQAAPFKPVYYLGQQVLKLEKNANDLWQIETSLGQQIEAKAVLIAAGVGAFGPNRPPLEHLESFEEKSVFYYVKNREDFRGKNLVIAGGGDSAVDWALSLAEIAKKVTVVHRRSKFRAAPESEAKLQTLAKAGKIDLVVPFQLESLAGQDGVLERVTVKSFEGETREIQAEFLLPFYGLAMDLGPIAQWGLQLNTSHIQIDPKDCSTNIPGIYTTLTSLNSS